MNMSKLTLFILTTLLLTPLMLSGTEIELRPQWDDTIPLANPHKGWYHHFFDNTVEKYLVKSDARCRLHARLLAAGVSYRDDSLLVDWYVQTYSPTFTVRSPEFFADAWQKTPTVLELEHYGIVKSKGNWTPRPGSSLEKSGAGRTGADYFRGALEQLHATYIGYHGYAREWLADNPELTVELLNRCGYWFFPHTVGLPDVLAADQSNTVTVVWQNRGVARAYHPYSLLLRLEGPDKFESESVSGNTRWLPAPAEKTWRETYALAIPATLTPGDYDLTLKLHSREAARDVKLPLKARLLDKDGFYALGRVRVATASAKTK